MVSSMCFRSCSAREKDEIPSERFPELTAIFEPADPAGWPLYYWVLAVAGGLLGLIILLAIIGSLMGPQTVAHRGHDSFFDGKLPYRL